MMFYVVIFHAQFPHTSQGFVGSLPLSFLENWFLCELPLGPKTFPFSFASGWVSRVTTPQSSFLECPDIPEVRPLFTAMNLYRVAYLERVVSFPPAEPSLS